MTEDKIRTAFEADFSSGGAFPAAVERDGEGYRLMQADAAWRVWQRAWKAAMEATCEEAVVVAKGNETDGLPMMQPMHVNKRLLRKIIADDIRTLCALVTGMS